MAESESKFFGEEIYRLEKLYETAVHAWMFIIYFSL